MGECKRQFFERCLTRAYHEWQKGTAVLQASRPGTRGKWPGLGAQSRQDTGPGQGRFADTRLSNQSDDPVWPLCTQLKYLGCFGFSTKKKRGIRFLQGGKALVRLKTGSGRGHCRPPDLVECPIDRPHAV